MVLKLLFLHRLHHGRKHRKAISKIIQKAYNEVFPIYAFNRSFFVIFIEFLKYILLPGRIVKTLNFDLSHKPCTYISECIKNSYFMVKVAVSSLNC